MPKRHHLVIYPGSFDPITLGHLDIVGRAAKLFERVEVAIGVNDTKRALLTPEERLELIRMVTQPMGNVDVATFSGLISEYAVSRGATALIRGLRQSGDFEYEVRMAHANARLAGGLETILLPTAARYAFVSSTIVRDVYRWGGDVTAFVPGPVAEALERRRSQSN